MATVEEAVRMVPVGKLKLADDNLRTNLGDLGELAASMKSSGVVQPLLVRKGDLLVVAGARRLEAAKKAGLKEVPVIEREFSEQERLEVMIVENLQREDLDPIEEATGYSRLRELGLNQTDIAKRVGRSQGHIAKRMALLVLPEQVQTHVAQGAMHVETAQELARLKDDPDTMAKIAKSAVRAIEKASKGGKGDKSAASEQADRTVITKVKQEVAERERRKKLDAKIRQLKKEKQPVVELESDEWGYQLKAPEGMALVQAQTLREGEVEFDPAKHAKLACHAVGVHPVKLDVIEVCTKPDSHPSRLEQVRADRERHDEEREKEHQKRVEIAERRQAFVTTVAFKDTIDKDVLLELCFLSFVEDAGYGRRSASEIAFNLLDIQDEAVLQKLVTESGQPEDVGIDEVDYDDLLIAYAARSVKNQHRATFVLACGSLESAWNSVPSAYLEVLARLGYTPSEPEKAQLAEALRRVEGGE